MLKAGPSDSCLPKSPSVKITTSATTLNTCDTLVIDISGGQPPYSLTIATTNSNVVTNVTLSPPSNQYTYVNRASPDGTMVGASVNNYLFPTIAELNLHSRRTRLVRVYIYL